MLTESIRKKIRRRFSGRKMTRFFGHYARLRAPRHHASSVEQEHPIQFFSSRYRGVIYNRTSGNWDARIGTERHYLGTYRTEVAAARAYNAAARIRYRDKARLNVIAEAA